jgi:hypothetical protein
LHTLSIISLDRWLVRDGSLYPNTKFPSRSAR